MIKQTAVVLLLAFTPLCCFERDFPIANEMRNRNLSYLTQAYESLLSHEPVQALENFQRTSTFLDSSHNSACVIRFLVFFGQTIAYDTLGLEDQTKQSIGSLLLAINQYDVGQETSANDVQVETFSSGEAYVEEVEFLYTIASTAPSSYVREFLYALIEELSEKPLPDLRLADPVYLGAVSWGFGSERTASAQNCKSFWKKVKHFLKEAADVIKYVTAGCKAAKELRVCPRTQFQSILGFF